MSVTILLGADVVPTQSNIGAFASGQSVLFDGLEEVWQAADMRFFNLETPLADEETPIAKCGPHLLAPTACVNGLANMCPTAVSLCNNHILDHGERGLRATADALDKANVAHFGAGENAAEAGKPFYAVCKGLRVGVYAVCESEYSIAGESKAGANPLDLLELGDSVRACKRACDCLIALYHGGRETYAYPSPNLRRVCRKIASCGADLVLCQHSHCIGAYEEYHGTTIVYGQGNFVFDVPDGGSAFNSGLLVRLTVGGGGERRVSFLPVLRVAGGAALARDAEADEILRAFHARSEQIKQEGFVEEAYRQYAASQRDKLLKVFFSGNTILRATNLLYGRRPSRVYGRQTKLDILNTLRCESIRELLTEGLKDDVL